MSYRIVILTLAETDIAEAAVWYQKQQKGLGDEFLATINASIERAALNPFAYQRIRRRPDVRRILAKSFPFRIFFVLRPADAIVIFRVLHNARDDRQWKQVIPK